MLKLFTGHRIKVLIINSECGTRSFDLDSKANILRDIPFNNGIIYALKGRNRSFKNHINPY